VATLVTALPPTKSEPLGWKAKRYFLLTPELAEKLK
jgi:hypothetical protein